MWPFRRRGKAEAKKKRGNLDHVVTGLIIGGAIGSIIGKKLMNEHSDSSDEQEEGNEDDAIV